MYHRFRTRMRLFLCYSLSVLQNCKKSDLGILEDISFILFSIYRLTLRNGIKVRVNKCLLEKSYCRVSKIVNKQCTFVNSS